MELKIDKEFKDLIPPLTSDEYKTLENSLLNEGCRDMLITWNGTIIDGHNRYEICKKHNIHFEVEEINFKNKDDVKVWMIDNQKGRRNLTDGWKFELAQTRKGILLEKGKRNMSAGGGNQKSGLSTIDRPDITPINTRDEIAKDLGWSTGKTAMADKVWREAEPEVKDKIKSNEITFNQAYNDIKKKEKKENLKSKKEEYESRILEKKNNDFSVDIFNTKEKFRVIYADPAWSYNDKQNTSQLGGAEKHYDTMTAQQIIDLPVNKITKENSVLFLWVTSPLLEDGFKVLNGWGFKYKTSFIWDKVKHNMGHYNSVRHEILLIATKGSCVPDNKKLYDSVQSIERNDNHSEKPIEFLDIIDDLYVYGNKLEMFCRKIKKNKWYGWGNEI